MASAHSIVGLFEQIQSAKLAVDQERCIVVRDRNAHCLKCAEACTSGCIALVDGQLVLSPEKCVGCGTCQTVCPTDALQVRQPTDAELYARCLQVAARLDGDVVIACEELLGAAQGLYDPDAVVSVVCLGRVDESLLVSLAAEPDVRRITVVHGACETCEHVAGYPVAKEVCETATILLQTWNSPVEVRFSAKLPARTRLDTAEFDKSKRAFFSDVKDGAKQVAVLSADYTINDILGAQDAQEEDDGSVYVKVDDRGVLPQQVPERRDRLLAALDSMGVPQPLDIHTRLWGSIAIDENLCTSCRMCTTFCPTGALFKFSTKSGQIGVKHRIRQCVACGCCESICPTQALTLSKTVPARAVADGRVQRFVMAPMANEPGKPHSIVNAMRILIPNIEMYER